MEPSKLSQWKKVIESNAQAKKESVSGMTLNFFNDWHVRVGKRSVVRICALAHVTVESSMGLMEAVLKSLEAVLFRLNGEAWQQQQHRESRESQIHTRNTQVSYSEAWNIAYFPFNMICFMLPFLCLWHIVDFFNWNEWTESTARYRNSFVWPRWEEMSLSAPFEHSALCEWRGSGQAGGAHTSHQDSAGHTAVTARTQPQVQSTGRYEYDFLVFLQTHHSTKY